jgi:hypothetical protein
MTPWPSGFRLTSQELENDLITAKLYVFKMLEPTPYGLGSPYSIERKLSSLLLFTRWRLRIGVASNSQLSFPWFREYRRTYREGGRGALLDAAEATRQVLAAAREGRLSLPIICRSPKDIRIRTDSFAELIGLSSAKSIPGDCWGLIYDYATEHGLRFAWQREFTARRNYLTDAAPAKINENTAISALYPWYGLWEIRDFLSHDPMDTCIFSHPGQITKAVKGWTERPQPAEICPDQQTAYLIRHSLRIVLECGENICALAEALARDSRFSADAETTVAVLAQQFEAMGFGNVIPQYQAAGRNLTTKSGVPEGSDLRTLIYRMLVAACIVVIAAFAARRDDEILRLDGQCIMTDAVADTWLHCYVEKNLRDYADFPVPPSVAVAVNLMKRLSAVGRGVDPKRSIFDFICPLFGSNIQVDSSSAMQMLAAWINVPPLPNGTYWIYTTRHLRRFFAITYFHSYKNPYEAALTLHLVHFNPNTTRGYVEATAKASTLRLREARVANENLSKEVTERLQADIDRAADFEAAASAFTAEILFDVLSEVRRLSGRGAKVIAAKLERMQRQIQDLLVLGSHDVALDCFNAALDKMVPPISFHPHPEFHSLCKCGSDRNDHEQAACLEKKLQYEPDSKDTGPDYAYADDETCAGCPNNIQLEMFRPYWGASIAEATRVHDQAEGTMRDAAALRLAHLRSLVEGFR